MKTDWLTRFGIALLGAIALAAFVLPFVFIDCGRFGWLAWPWC